MDYRKPPSHLFPAAVDDMLAIYRFVTEHFFTYTNIRPSKIILAGDSAGGNLMCSLVGLILKHKLPRPQGLFLAYPACDARKRFSPSRINSFEDPILYPTLLLMCLEEYLGYNQLTQYNPLASPLLLTEAFVGGAADDQRFPIAWPKTIVVIGKKDPLYDDSLRLCERMASSNVNFHCEIYRNLSHGFLSVDQLVPQSKQAIEDSIGFIRDLID